jgi:hypothetical protein
MAAHFRQNEIRSVALHSGSPKPVRDRAIEQLEIGELQVLFTVDLFNEGVDLPTLDTVLMLRPTQSPVVFLQQIGRGLRITEGKTHLDIVDFVGNHHSFLSLLRTLLSLSDMGAIVAPLVPAFYNRPQSIDDLINHSVGRVLDLFDIDAGVVKRWKLDETNSAD